MEESVVPTNQDSNIAPLVGSWCLVLVGATYSDTGERVETLGPNPEGRMALTSGGRIMFLFMRPNRQPPATDADRAILFNELTAYTGLVRLDGPGRFITAVDFAWHPAWDGEQLRFFTIDGDRLIIKTPESL